MGNAGRLRLFRDEIYYQNRGYHSWMRMKHIVEL
jgi:hypothetical protein